MKVAQFVMHHYTDSSYACLGDGENKQRAAQQVLPKLQRLLDGRPHIYSVTQSTTDVDGLPVTVLTVIYG